MTKGFIQAPKPVEAVQEVGQEPAPWQGFESLLPPDLHLADLNPAHWLSAEWLPLYLHPANWAPPLWIAVGALLALGLLALLRALAPRQKPKRRSKPQRGRQHRKPRRSPSAATHALIDGSNVMHWYVDAKRAKTPSLAPVQAVIAALKAEGRAAGVIFDATAGHRLFERYVHGPEFKQLLPEAEDVYVVPKGESADAYLLDYARAHGLTIISNDRYRDHPEAADLPRRAGHVSGDKSAPKITLQSA